LRALVWRSRNRLPVHASAGTLRSLAQRFGYAFRPMEQVTFYGLGLSPRRVAGPFRVGPVRVVPFRQGHGVSTTLGFRFGPVAYSTDVVTLGPKAFAALAGVKVWIVDCLREEPHPTHAHLARTLEWIARVQPERAVLTHMNHSLDYRTLRAKCPPGVEPGYDGMVLEVADDEGTRRAVAARGPAKIRSKSRAGG
jgi:phosphoribosyl 1,2-cyclic phosphate phosphodiesterase